MKSKATKGYWMIKSGDKYVDHDVDCYGLFFEKTRNEGHRYCNRFAAIEDMREFRETHSEPFHLVHVIPKATPATPATPIKMNTYAFRQGDMEVRIVDYGVEEGIVLEMESHYIINRIKIQPLGGDWLEKVGLMFLKAAIDFKNIDWDKRFNG